MGLRRRVIVFAIVALGLVAFSLYCGREQLARIPRPSFWSGYGWGGPSTSLSSTVAAGNATHILTTGRIAEYVDSIMNLNTIALPKLECPALQVNRYQYLRTRAQQHSARAGQIDYLFALDLRQVLELLPQLIGSVVEAIRFLGSERCALSIVEGRSLDGSGEVLAALRPRLDALTTTYYFKTSDLNPQEGDRIGKLAALRNLALQPLQDEPARYTVDTTVVFANDVALCVEDLLEIVHQRHALGADMTCSFDWTYAGEHPTFYDVWIARGMTGDSFFKIPPDGNWDSVWNLFWNDPHSQARFHAHRPFQVFTCWNGLVAFTAQPLVEHQVTFRSSREGECFAREPQLFCKDLWLHGYGKIATVPSVNLEYSLGRGRDIKALKGFTSQWARDGAEAEDKIEWRAEPPDPVKCIPSYDHQFFEVWNLTSV